MVVISACHNPVMRQKGVMTNEQFMFIQLALAIIVLVLVRISMKLGTSSSDDSDATWFWGLIGVIGVVVLVGWWLYPKRRPLPKPVEIRVQAAAKPKAKREVEVPQEEKKEVIPLRKAAKEEEEVIDLMPAKAEEEESIELAPLLGMQLAHNGKGVFIDRVIPKSVAAKAGARKGDEIRSINGSRPKTLVDTYELVFGVKIDRTFEMTVNRGGDDKRLVLLKNE